MVNVLPQDVVSSLLLDRFAQNTWMSTPFNQVRDSCPGCEIVLKNH